nr:MAG TPA: hypothetical protein [Caudoviricetes sp.]
MFLRVLKKSQQNKDIKMPENILLFLLTTEII